MFEFTAYSRFLNLKGSIRLYYVVAFGVFLALLAFLLYRDFMVTLTIIVCSVAGYFLLSIPPTEINIVVDEDAIYIDDKKISWDESIEWAVVNLHDVVEFVIRTDKINHQFYYFYVDSEEEDLKALISFLGNTLPYNESTPGLNPLHIVLRNVGLK